MKWQIKKMTALCLAGMTALTLSACGGDSPDSRLKTFEKEEERTVTLFSPMEKTKPGADNVARSASEKTVAMAEEQLGVSVDYITYTAEDYQDKTYDDVAL